jgi:LPS export ABC transporter protein LptC
MISGKYRLKIGFWCFILVFALLLNLSCSDKIPMINRINSKEELPSVSIENMEATYTEEGRLKGKLMAPLLDKYDGIVEPYVDFKKGISIVLYDKDNKIENSLTADKAVYYQSKKTWEATGNVVITNMNGDIFRTDKLYGDDKEKKFYTNRLVTITKSDGSVLFAKSGFESNSDFTIYQYIDVRGKIFFKEEFLIGADTTKPSEAPAK